MTYSIEIFRAFPKERKNPTWYFVLMGYAIALALYYVDEGNYHFLNLIEQPLEWIFLSMYALLIAGACRMVYAVLPSTNLAYRTRLLLATLLGILSIPVIIIIIAGIALLLTS